MCRCTTVVKLFTGASLVWLLDAIDIKWSACLHSNEAPHGAEWLSNFSWPGLAPTSVNQGLFEIVADVSSKEYCEAFAAVARNPGTSTFGDEGPGGHPGLGGLSNYAVLKVRQGVTVDMFGIFHKDDPKLEHPWFADVTAIDDPRVDFVTYSNNRMAMCWEQHHLMRCRMKPGAVMVAGSGAWRDTSLGDCNLKAADGIKEIQTPDPKYLQYVFDLKNAAAECSYYSMNSADILKSMEGEAEQFWLDRSEREL